jgi:hypothetical protein
MVPAPITPTVLISMIASVFFIVLKNGLLEIGSA